MQPRALPFVNIWTKPNKLEQWVNIAAHPEWKAYSDCLEAYRKTLTCNNPRYNEEKPTQAQLDVAKQADDLVNRLHSETGELKAAALHLKGLTQRNLRQNPLPTFELALAEQTISPLSKAVLYTAMGTTLNYQGRHVDALRFLDQAETLLPTGDLSALSEDDRQIIASLYSSIGYGYRKLHQAGFEKAEAAYQKARFLWPENNVIANNHAALLSKISDPRALKKACDILHLFIQEAKEKSYFVTCYYLADVCIKLAAFAEKESAELAHYKKGAEESLAAAQAALQNNKNYSPNYRKKGESRLALQRGNLALVTQNFDEAKRELDQAALLRAEVEEHIDKRGKFTDKFVKPPFEHFSANSLFRHPQQPQETQNPNPKPQPVMKQSLRGP